MIFTRKPRQAIFRNTLPTLLVTLYYKKNHKYINRRITSISVFGILSCYLPHTYIHTYTRIPQTQKMHFPALLADQRLTQLQHFNNSHAQYSSNCKATHTSPAQISCVILILLGMLAKAAFAVESLDWMDYTIICILTGIWYSRRRPTTYVVL